MEDIFREKSGDSGREMSFISINIINLVTNCFCFFHKLIILGIATVLGGMDAAVGQGR